MNPVVDNNNLASRPSFKKALLLAVLFGALAYLGNLARLLLGFNLSFIFGSTFTLLGTLLLGGRLTVRNIEGGAEFAVLVRMAEGKP